MSVRRSRPRGSAPSGRPAFVTDQRVFSDPLTLGVLSDTHLYPGGRRQLPSEIPALFSRFGCGLILHAGDCCTIDVLRPLADIAPVLVVVGNNDRGELLELGEREIAIRVGEKRVALVHGDGGRSARTEARERFAGNVDLVVYGHSHVPKIEMVDGTILFNPGSPTDRRWTPHFGVGVIRIANGSIDPELILFADPRELDGVNPG